MLELSVLGWECLLGSTSGAGLCESQAHTNIYPHILCSHEVIKLQSNRQALSLIMLERVISLMCVVEQLTVSYVDLMGAHTNHMATGQTNARIQSS